MQRNEGNSRRYGLKEDQRARTVLSKKLGNCARLLKNILQLLRMVMDAGKGVISDEGSLSATFERLCKKIKLLSVKFIERGRWNYEYYVRQGRVLV